MRPRSVILVLGSLAFAITLSSPASAQMPNVNLMPELKSKTPEEKEREEKADRAYRDSLRKIPNATGTTDPWGDVRGAEASSKSSPKPKPAPAKRAKADAPAN